MSKANISMGLPPASGHRIEKIEFAKMDSNLLESVA
jgi:hypothetical protein